MNNQAILNPIFCNQKSFYNKAKYSQALQYVEPSTSKWRYTLYSYNTQVLDIIKYDFKDIDKQVYMLILNYDIDSTLLFSNTTLKHIKEFIKQVFNFDLKINKSIIEYSNEQFIYLDKDNVSSVFNNNDLFSKLEYIRRLENL